ncbi:putative late blight resistance protein homolog R1B-16 [Henckelia pumila]|uniref:putative late blight resistance protein homolog R1B-16 n=1 Tax=Henckelia pumila TaxID=405737 RepID=UPI003C6E36F3
MAAYGAVVSLTRILQQIKDPHSPVRHEKQQIQSLQEKVSFLLDFLENYSVCTDKVVKDLEIKIRDAAYRAEDIIESYISTSILSRLDGVNSIGVFETFRRDMDKIIQQTNSMQQEVKRVLELNHVQQRKNTLHVDRSRLTFTNTSTTPSMVGLYKDKDKIKDWLTSSSSKREVISIVGMGGIGKTTLARKLLDDPLVVCQFDVRAWVTVSQEYQMREIFAGLLNSIIKLNSEVGKASCADLGERLYKSLKGRKYMIVMDDVWDAKVWDEVKRFFPDEDNESRVVLTTRLKNVGDDAASFDYRHDMRPLNFGESWHLFCQKAFGGDWCPPCLEGITLEIIENCKGLPLSIVVIGGLLSMDKTAGYWKTIATAMKSFLSTDGGQCSNIFSLSYDHLPAHLKPCYLYFAIFPEDYIVRRSDIIMLWIAEGFIKPKESKSLEDIAEECLEDLLNRSLIMVLKLGRDGKVKTYRIHDLLRDFCITQAQKEKFLCIATHPEGIRSERRLSIQPSTPMKSNKYIFNSNGPPSTVRSLLLYGENADISVSEPSLGLIRVWDMRSGKCLSGFPTEVVRLVHLRYLSLCFLGDRVPASISSLWGLQTLVINSAGYATHLPMKIWTMLHLRHVEIRYNYCYLPDPPTSNLVILANLQTLLGIINFRLTDEIIKKIPKLKRLKVIYTKDWSHYHLSNIVYLNKLESLYLELSYNHKLAFPQNFKFPAALKKLTLVSVGLLWEDLTVVGSLPNLEVLVLHYDSCTGAVWEPNEEEFRHLKSLHLYNLDLVEWRAVDSHFPKLEWLKIIRCMKLKEIPIEIGNIPTLEKIELDSRIPPSVVTSVEQILDQQRSLGNDALQLFIL